MVSHPGMSRLKTATLKDLTKALPEAMDSPKSRKHQEWLKTMRSPKLSSKETIPKEIEITLVSSREKSPEDEFMSLALSIKTKEPVLSENKVVDDSPSPVNG